MVEGVAYSLSLEKLWKGCLRQHVTHVTFEGVVTSEEVRPAVSELPFLLFVNLAMSTRASPPEDAVCLVSFVIVTY